jgi:hypothetical protein
MLGIGFEGQGICPVALPEFAVGQVSPDGSVVLAVLPVVFFSSFQARVEGNLVSGPCGAVSRFFITLLSVVMTAAMFLYWPSPQNPAPQNGYSYYHSRPSNPDSLAADELEPDRYSADRVPSGHGFTKSRQRLP